MDINIDANKIFGFVGAAVGLFSTAMAITLARERKRKKYRDKILEEAEREKQLKVLQEKYDSLKEEWKQMKRDVILKEEEQKRVMGKIEQLTSMFLDITKKDYLINDRKAR